MAAVVGGEKWVPSTNRDLDIIWIMHISFHLELELIYLVKDKNNLPQNC